MSTVKLACPNRECRQYAEERIVQADASFGHITLRNAFDGDCAVCGSTLQPYETVLLDAGPTQGHTGRQVNP